jgi:outer membrane protein assembly factor BamB
VGAYNETANGYTGAGHVYVYSAKTGALLHTLTSPNAQANGQFSGFGVAVSGNIVVVGAWNEAANGYAEAGHAYIFNVATGALLRTLTSPNAQTGGEFGNGIAVNGNIVVVGAWHEAVNGFAGAGRAYIYSADTGTLLRSFTSPNTQTGGQFGDEVGVAGKIVAVGAETETADSLSAAGHAYTFNLLSGKLITAFTSPNPVTGGYFGSTVTLAGNVLGLGAQTETANGYTGAGRAYIYSADTGTLLRTFTSPNAQTGGQFGWAIALNGNTVDVSGWLETANGEAGAGHVYIFNIDTGALIRTLTSPNAQTNGGFGEAVAAIGNIVVVGAPFEAADGYAAAGNAYVYFMAPPLS